MTEKDKHECPRPQLHGCCMNLASALVCNGKGVPGRKWKLASS